MNHCIYRHLKPNGEVFYIGIGSNLKRPFTHNGRNLWWYKVVEKYPDYEVQVLKTNLTKDEACELEQILISWYKRKDCCDGTLVNLTDGGESTYGRIMEDWQKEYLSDLKKEGFKSGKYKISEAAIINSQLSRQANWDENPDLKILMARKVSDNKSKYDYLKIDRLTNQIVESFDTFYKLKQKYPNVGKTVINSVCNGSKKSYLGYIWRYRSKLTGEILIPEIKESLRKRQIIDTDTLEIYESLTLVANNINMLISTLSAKLRGRNPNDTPYRFLDEYENNSNNTTTLT